MSNNIYLFGGLSIQRQDVVKHKILKFNYEIMGWEEILSETRNYLTSTYAIAIPKNVTECNDD